jgi:hypothetical protein
MGGLNSGRWGGWPTIERTGAITLDANRILARRNRRDEYDVAYEGRRGSAWRILCHVQLNEAAGLGTLRIVHSAFRHLSASVPQADYIVDMTATPCHFGGQRWWFLCPVDGRRVAKLYLPNGAHRFASREAQRLGYHSQRIGQVQKGHARLGRLYAKLGTPYSEIFQPVPDKPPRMRRKTYNGIVAAIEAARQAHIVRYGHFWASFTASLNLPECPKPSQSDEPDAGKFKEPETRQ